MQSYFIDIHGKTVWVGFFTTMSYCLNNAAKQWVKGIDINKAYFLYAHLLIASWKRERKRRNFHQQADESNASVSTIGYMHLLEDFFLQKRL